MTFNPMIPESIKQLIKKVEDEDVAYEFWKEIEEESSKLEVTCDYYLAEFY